MSRFQKTISVVANPWFALDHKGRPCGVVPVEPREFGSHLGFVGAKVDRNRTTVTSRRPGEILPPAQDTVYEFSDKPVQVGATVYYRELLRSGALLPADESAARWANLKFVPPAQALAQARKKAEAEFEADYGVGSLADLRAMHNVHVDGHPEQPAAPPSPPEQSESLGEGGKAKRAAKTDNAKKDGE